jgi:hypothetical protein
MQDEATVKGIREVFSHGRELIDATGGELVITRHGAKWVTAWTAQPGFWMPRAVAHHEDLATALDMLATQLKVQGEMLAAAQTKT